jgi:IMP dehydrogenase
MKALSFDDVSLVPRYNNIPSRKDVDTSVQLGKLRLKIPILSANMDTITGPSMASAMSRLGGVGVLHRFCDIAENVAMYDEATCSSPTAEAIVSLGVNEGLDRFGALYEHGARYFCIDVAHGHSQSVGRMITSIKEAANDVFVIAGNVCEATGAAYLVDKGADAIKIGIGPGSVCSTRVKTGFGVPQFTAIRDCNRINTFIIADGGIRTPGDAVKAFVAGADMIMIGGMLAGTNETPGELIEEPFTFEYGEGVLEINRSGTYTTNFGNIEIPRYKIFRGMASREAQDDFMGSMPDWKAAEGIEIKVEAKGPVSNVVGDLMGGNRS